MVQHTIAGVGFTAFVVTTAIVGLNSPSGQQVATAETVLATPAAAPAALAPELAQELAAAAARAKLEQAAARSAKQAKLAARAARQANRRAKTLAHAGKSVAAEEARLKAAAAKAAAEAAAAARARAAAARARAAAAKKAADAAAEKRRATTNRGYLPGTNDPKEMARQIMRNKYGYGADQFSCFNNIIMRESMWDVHATNPSSGAYGIPQALPGSKMATVAPDWRHNPATQIIWAIEYMDDRYGSPCEAWTFKRSHGWY
jgi:hypothetical protein